MPTTESVVLLMTSLLLLGGRPSLTKDTRERVKLLLLVPWPDEFGRDYAGWDGGQDLIAGARVAQEDINNRTDLLSDYVIELVEAGHEACGLTDNSLGLRNLVSHAPSVSAVLGLFCSTNTQQLSPLAGHKEIRLVQLTASNSPLFRSNPTMYPHQWRFLVSASTHSQMMLRLMDMFNWQKIAIVQDVESYYYSTIGNYLHQKLNDSQILHSGVLFKHEGIFYTGALKEIQTKGARIIFISANANQVSKLLCMAGKERLIYPNYVWVVIDVSLSELESYSTCNVSILHTSLHGSLISYFRLRPRNDTNKLFTAGNDYYAKYYRELKIVSRYYTGHEDTLKGNPEYAGLAHDQVWAFALALNQSLPMMKEQNLSMTDAKLGNVKIRYIFENELAKIDFIGVSGHIKFSRDREVSTPIDLYQAVNNSQKLIGGCEVLNSSVVNCTVSPTLSVPSSNFDVQEITLSLKVRIPMLLWLFLTITIITVVFLLMWKFKERPEIKASSFKLSIIQFCGLYLLCLSMLVSIIFEWSGADELKYLCYVDELAISNGLNLIMATLFLKLVRVFHIFENPTMKDLGWELSNWFLLICVIVISAFPTVFLVAWFAIDHYTIHKHMVNHFTQRERFVTSTKHCATERQLELYQGLSMFGYQMVFFSLNIYLASRTRKTYSNFKDTKKINLLMAILVVLIALTITSFILISQYELYLYYTLVNYIAAQLIANACLILLFFPKLWWLKDMCCNKSDKDE